MGCEIAELEPGAQQPSPEDLEVDEVGDVELDVVDGVELGDAVVDPRQATGHVRQVGQAVIEAVVAEPGRRDGLRLQ